MRHDWTLPDAASHSPVRARGSGTLRVGHLEIDKQGRDARWKGCSVTSTRERLSMLLALARDPDRVLSREVLLDASQRDNIENTDRCIDSTISRLRADLRAADPAFDAIVTCRGHGYRICTRRLGASVPAFVGSAGLVVAVRPRMAWLAGRDLELRPAAFDLLLAMARRRGQIMETNDLVRHGCPGIANGQDGYLAARTLVSHLRTQAQKAAPDTRLVASIYGVGVRIDPALEIGILDADSVPRRDVGAPTFGEVQV